MIDEKIVHAVKDGAAVEASERYLDIIVAGLLAKGATEEEIAHALDMSVHIHKGLLEIGGRQLLVEFTYDFTSDPEKVAKAIKASRSVA